MGEEDIEWLIGEKGEGFWAKRKKKRQTDRKTKKKEWREPGSSMECDFARWRKMVLLVFFFPRQANVQIF